MNSLWIWVALLAAVLLALNGRYLVRARRQVERYWAELHEALSERHRLLRKALDGAGTADGRTTLERALDQVETRPTENLKRLKQRSALEFRCAVQARRYLAGAAVDESLLNALAAQDRAVYSALRCYEIAGRSYNHRLESLSGKVLGIAGTFTPAPELDIEPVIVDEDGKLEAGSRS